MKNFLYTVAFNTLILSLQKIVNRNKNNTNKT